MIKHFPALAVAFFMMLSLPCHAKFELSSSSAILIDADSGVVLYEKEANKKMFPASTTKIMTAILTLEKANLDDIATVSFNAVNSIDYDSSKLFLSENEQISVRDLLYGLLIASANDAANVLAEHISGSQEKFAAFMNERAKELGAENTNFVNAHGLHNENHYTTAKDLAIIARHAMMEPLFKEIVSRCTYTINPTNVFKEERVLTSTNFLINPKSPYYCKYARGIKTGYTSVAGSCLVSFGTLDKTNVISVVLGAQSSEDGKLMSFVDSKNSIEYGLLTLKPQLVVKSQDIISSVPIINGYENEALLKAQSPVLLHLPEGVSSKELERKEYILKHIEVPIKKGDILGRMEYWYKDYKVGETYMVAADDYKESPVSFIVNSAMAVFKSPWFCIPAVILLTVFITRKIGRAVRRKKRRSVKSFSRKGV